MKESVVADKSFQFAKSVVELYKTIIKPEKEFVLSKQLLRSGTSIGANIAEASGSISKNEFIAKIQISYKEAHESRFWIRLLKETNFINEAEHEKLKEHLDELISIINSILKTSKLNL